MPHRHAAEGLGVAHLEVVGDAVGRAHREGADALRGSRVDLLHLLLPLAGAAHRLAEIVVDDGAAGRLAEAAHQRVLHLGAVAAAGLDEAGAEIAQHVAEREDLLLVGPDRRDVDALRVKMALVARHRQAERAGLHAVADEALHPADLVVGGGALLALVAHHVIAHCGVADQIADIDAEVAVHLLEVFGEGLPGEFERVENLHRDRFDVGEKFVEPPLLLSVLLHRRQRQRAIAEDHAGRAVVARERAQRVPGDLRVVMAMVVDKARRHDEALGIDGACRRPRQFADLDDLAVLDPDIAAERRRARAVDDAAVLDQQIVGHGVLLRIFYPSAACGRVRVLRVALTLTRLAMLGTLSRKRERGNQLN